MAVANLVSDGNQGSAETAELHVSYFVENVLTVADLIQQHSCICACVDLILHTFDTDTSH